MPKSLWFVECTRQSEVRGRFHVSESLFQEELKLVAGGNTSRLKILLSRLLASTGYRHRLYLECLLGSSGHKATRAELVDVRELEAKDADAFVAFRQGPDADLFLTRLQRGQRCFAAFVGTHLASVSWAVKNQATLWALNADFFVEDGTAYIFDSYTHPDFRGKRLQTSIFQRICEYCKDKNVGKVVTFVAATNTANLRSRARLGFAVTGAVRRFRFGSLAWYLSTGSAPKLRRHSSRK